MRHKIISGEELFDLIKSLTKAEKRNLKVPDQKRKRRKVLHPAFRPAQRPGGL